MSVSKKKNPLKSPSERRQRVSQSDVPAFGLTDAIRVSKAIVENYASSPTTPLDVATALGITPTSSQFKMLTGASIAYGLTEGGYGAPEIKVTKLGERVNLPMEEGDDVAAKREAILKPRIVGEFLRKYDGKQIPNGDIAANVISSLGCPRERSSEIFEMIVAEADALGLIADIKGKKFGKLSGVLSKPSQDDVASHVETADEFPNGVDGELEDAGNGVHEEPLLPAQDVTKEKRVFITHGKNTEILDQIREVVELGGFEPVISVRTETTAKPIPEKVMDDMRSCGAAIIHVGSEGVLTDADGNSHPQINPNVLIEIGAAMALYKGRFILVVEDGVKLPSNLQGLYESRYSGSSIEFAAGMRILKALRGLKNTP